ncbi:UNVERIFIED_CONTAM: hypothetical protein Sindi_3132700, partial [Sesamum indicum]
MGKAGAVLRRSIFSFLQNYQYFTSTPALLAFPFAVSTLLSQSLVSSSSLFPLVHGRLKFSFSCCRLPSLFGALHRSRVSSCLKQFLHFFLSVPLRFPFSSSPRRPSSRPSAPTNRQNNLHFLHGFHFSVPSHHPTLQLISHSCGKRHLLLPPSHLFPICSDILGLLSPRSQLLLSATGAVIYSIILANAYITCNLALVLAGIEKRGGFISILKACVLIQGRTATALSLAVPINMALAAIEALFQYRVMSAYHRAKGPDSAMLLEGMFVGYLYALLIVLDTVVGCVFWRSCKTDFHTDREEAYSHRIEIREIDGKFFAKTEA